MSSPNSSLAVESTSPLEVAIGNDKGERPPISVSKVAVEKFSSANLEQSNVDGPTTPTMASIEKLGLDGNFSDNTPSPQSEPTRNASPPFHPSRASSTPDPEEDPRPGEKLFLLLTSLV
jgi:hypothetical protein